VKQKESPLDIKRLPWPLYVLDFEASSLEPGGYPIEVGLALWPAPDKPVHSWSTLICPTEDWLQHGDWSKASRAVHGISQSELKTGPRPQEVAQALNEALSSSGVAWCDGGPYDAQWARTLFKAVGLKPAFSLCDWHSLLLRLESEARERALRWLETTPSKHRAQEDAEHLVLALAHAVSIEVGPPQRLEAHIPALARLTAAATDHQKPDDKPRSGLPS
jgi:hypothetical protein